MNNTTSDHSTQMSSTTRKKGMSALVVIATLLCAASMFVFGFWAFFAPESFIDFVNYHPYNEHLTHDAGAFQIGIGSGLVFALIWRDSLIAGLAGFAVASGLHTLSHYMDRHIGGSHSDIPSLGLVTVVALVGIWARFRATKKLGAGYSEPMNATATSPAFW